MTDSIYRAFSASEWEALEKRHAERGGRAVPAPAAVRSDSTQRQQEDGLTMTTRFDDAGRPIREFAYATPGHPKTWMNEFKAPLQRMLFINNNERSKQECERRAAQILADERQIERQIAEHGAGSFRVDLGA